MISFAPGRPIEEIWDEGVSLNEINICDILPETETIMIHEKYNVCYHGRECEAYAVKLYKYNNYMITYTFDSDGNDLEVFGIEEYVDAIEIKLKKKKILKNKSWSDNICKLLEVSVTVQSLDDFSYEIFLNEIPLIQLDTLVDFFQNLYPEKGQQYLVKYVKSIYKSKLKN